MFAVVAEQSADDVYQQGFRFDVVGQPAPALEVDPQLVEALGRTGVQRGQAVRADQAVGLQAMVNLEALHGGNQCCVVEVGVGDRPFAEVAFRGQSASQQRDPLVAHAWA
ncbi:hypothetical protein D9M68_720910 [compost metagenome]